ncbi:MAG: tetratricopeptide repeat protein [Spirochaetota bacterium]
MDSNDHIEAIPDRRLLEAEYANHEEAYQALLAGLELRIRAAFSRAGIKPTIKGRIKSFDSLYKKRLRLLRNFREKGSEPSALGDIVGLRIVCPFLGDLELVEKILRSDFSVIEVERKGAERSFKEFGYESIHMTAEIPQQLRLELQGLDISLFEIQLRTILQEAWAEVEHELVYKAELSPLDEPLKRKLAALSANLTLSDIIFQEIREYQQRLGSELNSRRQAFYSKIEEAIDGSMYAKPAEGPGGPKNGETLEEFFTSGTASIDDLLLDALSAHNRKNYALAIKIYQAILEQPLGEELASIVHKHRGMAYFAESRYDEAIEDFGASLARNPDCYKSAYFRGVVRSVVGDYGAAISDFNRSLQINPYQFFALYRRAQGYTHLGDFPKALADVEEAAKIEPRNSQALQLKALLLDKLRM